MNENLKSKISGKLDRLDDEAGRQLLDYMEFLESKYHRSVRSPSTVQKIAENLEDRLGTVSVTDVATKGGAQVLEAAGKLMDGLAAASRVVAEELQPPPQSSSDESQQASTETEEEPSSEEETNSA
jgi:hypothetical protein